MLLSLSDSNLISLNGQPTWFTVCPVDPNLPSLPKPVPYRHHRQQRNMEHFLSKFVHKAQAFAHLTGGSPKRPSTPPANTLEPNLAEPTKRVFNHKHDRKIVSGQHYPDFLRLLNSDADLSTIRHSINEAKLAKLNSIITVLRESEDTGRRGQDSPDSAPDSAGVEPPAFTHIFKTEDEFAEGQERVGKKGGKKKRRKVRTVPKTVLHSLRQDLANCDISSNSSDQEGDSSPADSVNDQSMAWMASQTTNERDESNQDSSHGNHFHIPSLRASISGGKRNRISNYNFDSESQISNIAEGEVEVDDMGESDKRKQEQVHYKLVDTKSLLEEEGEDRTKDPAASLLPSIPVSAVQESSPDCKFYPVPVEISVHHINVVDVDSLQVKSDKLRSHSMKTRSTLACQTDVSADRTSLRMGKTLEHNLEESSTVHRQPNADENRKQRSMSVGDMECLTSEEEVLLVRTPVTEKSNQHNPEAVYSAAQLLADTEQTGSVDYVPVDVSGVVPNSLEDSEEMTSLDVHAIRVMNYHRRSSSTSECVISPEKKIQLQSMMASGTESNEDHVHKLGVPGAGRSKDHLLIQKCHSMGDLADPVIRDKRE